MIDYAAYINSKTWRSKVEERLRIAGNQCEWPNCKKCFNLQGHHLHYRTFGHENVYDDIRVYCTKHHIYADLERMENNGKTNDEINTWIWAKFDRMGFYASFSIIIQATLEMINNGLNSIPFEDYVLYYEKISELQTAKAKLEQIYKDLLRHRTVP